MELEKVKAIAEQLEFPLEPMIEVAGDLIPLDVRVRKRYWSKVDRGDGCWLWVGARNRDGNTNVYKFHSFR